MFLNNRGLLKYMLSMIDSSNVTERIDVAEPVLYTNTIMYILSILFLTAIFITVFSPSLGWEISTAMGLVFTMYFYPQLPICRDKVYIEDY